MDKIKINYDALKNARGFEYADNKAGVSCRLVPIEEAREQDKKVKALEILVDKDVNIGFLLKCNSIDEYNDMCDYVTRNGVYVEHLTQEEYSLLKEVLLWRKNQPTQKN